ncbi:MAG: zinc ribbon domain-containing protein [Clostridia bacterium]|nr:zinc ribbon domain-containing protein [Clostridia bacterium]
MNLLSVVLLSALNWPKWVLIALAVVFGLFVISTIVKAIRKWKNRVASNLLGGLKLSDIKKALQDGKSEAENPSPRTLFGATSIYLPKILNDFPDFHMPEAKNSLNLLLNEYLQIRYGQADRFATSNAEFDLAAMVPRASEPAELADIAFHDCAIRSYIKTSEYATITYVATIGYAAGGKRFEDRYLVDSTLKLSEEGIPKKLLICSQCGGAIDSTALKYCPYCGSGIVWDTKLSWRFTAVAPA